MSALDYIKIRGIDGEPPESAGDFFEIFQGAGGGLLGDGSSASGGVAISEGGSLMVQVDASAPISEDAAIAEAIWTAQSAMLAEESAYVDELNATFKSKQAIIPTKTNFIFDLLSEIAEYAAGKLAYLLMLAQTNSPIISEIASFAVEFSLEKAIEGLRVAVQKGQELCAAIKAENDALLSLTSSRANYQFRQDALKLHTEQIENMLLHINRLESQITDTLSGEEKSADEDWAEWTANMENSTDQIAAWMEGAFAAADVNYDDSTTADLPVPTVPNLPTLPPTADPKVVAFWFLMKFGTKLVVELLKNWIEKGHGKNHEEFLTALKDLRYNDEMLDLGGVRVWLKNKVIQYG